jgi:hypothetical protein
MDDAKEVFMRDKELAGVWSGFTHGPHAPRVFAFADAIMMNSGVDIAEMRGAIRYKSILQSLADVDDSVAAIPTSGLRHDLDPKSRSKKITVSKQKA